MVHTENCQDPIAIKNITSAIDFISDMLTFFWLHEWSHVQRYHFRYLANPNFNVLSELKVNSESHNKDKNSSCMRRSFEFDADFCSCINLLKLAYSPSKSVRKLFELDMGKIQRRCANICLASTLISIYGSTHDKETDVTYRTDPNATLNYYCIRNIFNTFFSNKTVGEFERFYENIRGKLNFVMEVVPEMSIMKIIDDENLEVLKRSFLKTFYGKC